MFFKKNRLYIYILIFFLLINSSIPIITYSFNDDSIYVWSNDNSSISTSADFASNEQEITNNNYKETAR